MDYSYVFFLGRQSALCASEAWCLLSATQEISLVHVNDNVLIVKTSTPIESSLFSRLGGSDRVGKVIGTFSQPPQAHELLEALSPSAKKFSIGLSTFGVHGYTKKFLIDMKKLARSQGFKMSFVEPKGESRLSSAQVLFNGLYREPNAEITIYPFNNSFLAIQTIWVQDIQAYERRDTARPARDAHVGMLPPKLAQIMLNMALPLLPENAAIYDPFCGLGTIIQEGMLMGYPMIGSDLQERMLEMSKKNIDHIKTLFPSLNSPTPIFFQHNVTAPFPSLPQAVSAIVTEPYLGTPKTTPPPYEEAESFMNSLMPLYRSFLQHVHALLPAGAPIVFILPRIRSRAGWASFDDDFIDEIQQIGYSVEHLVPAPLQPYFPDIDPSFLAYYRPEAVVGREIRLWTRA